MRGIRDLASSSSSSITAVVFTTNALDLIAHFRITHSREGVRKKRKRQKEGRERERWRER